MDDNPPGFVSVESVVSIVRFHPDGKGYGSPYSFSCVLTVVGTEGWISAGSGKFTPKVFRKIEEALRGFGLTSIRFERRTHGRHRLRLLK